MLISRCFDKGGGHGTFDRERFRDLRGVVRHRARPNAGSHKLAGILHYKDLNVLRSLAATLVLLIGSCAVGNYAAVVVDETGAADVLGTDSTSRIKQLIDSNEVDQAIRLATEAIDDIEGTSSRYDSELVKPLTLLGDGYSKSGDHLSALDAYDRARHITRLNNGLHHIAQVDVLYREAQSYFALGQIQVANDRHETAYGVYARAFEQFSVELLPGIFRLGDWYGETSNIFAARGLYEYALRITEQHLSRDHPDNLRALKSLARTYRLERYRPPQNLGFDEPPTPSLFRTSDRPFVYYAELNSFAPGEKALLEVTRIELAREEPEQESIARAKLELADWYLLFDKFESASVVYNNVIGMYEGEEDSQFFQSEFVEPVPLHLPLTVDPMALPKEKRAMPSTGSIDLAFRVTKKGDVRDVRVLSSEPVKTFDKQFRNAMRQARYRPAFENGEAIDREELNLVHSFVYFPVILDSPEAEE